MSLTEPATPTPVDESSRSSESFLLTVEGRATLGDVFAAQFLNLRGPQKPRPIFMVLAGFIAMAAVFALFQRPWPAVNAKPK